MKKSALNIFLILFAVNTFSQEIVGRILTNETEIPIPGATVSLNQEFFAVSDTTGQFVLRHDCKADSAWLEILFIGFSKLTLNGVPSSENVNLGEIRLLKVPVKLAVTYVGISRRKQKKYLNRDRKKFEKEKRNFVFQDTWISTSNGGYWMRKTEKEYEYVVNFNEVNQN